jgi:hypothetical protein
LATRLKFENIHCTDINIVLSVRKHCEKKLAFGAGQRGRNCLLKHVTERKIEVKDRRDGKMREKKKAAKG